MQRRSFWRAFLDGFVAIGQGWFDIMDSFSNPSRQWRYEDHFGTDEEQIRKDREAVANDMQAAIYGIISQDDTEEE